MKLTIGFFVALFALSAVAAEGRFHPNHLFIKMNAGESLVKSPLIKSSNKIFGDLYLVKTSNPVALQKSLKAEKSVSYTEKDFYAGKSVMPKLEPMDPVSMKMKGLFERNFTNFNDPQVGKLWAFSSANGMEVDAAPDNVELCRLHLYPRGHTKAYRMTRSAPKLQEDSPSIRFR